MAVAGNPTEQERPMTEARVFTNSGAGESLTFRMVTHVTWAQSQEVGDAEGHVASLACFRGLAFFPDQTVGEARFVAATDYTNGAGAFTLYPILTFDDGTVLRCKSVGTAAVDGKRTRFVGTVTVLGGEGRFAGATGKGSLTGTRHTPLSLGADLVSDYTITLRK
jgi:hypothetical protein